MKTMRLKKEDFVSEPVYPYRASDIKRPFEEIKNADRIIYVMDDGREIILKDRRPKCCPICEGDTCLCPKEEVGGGYVGPV